MSDNGTAVHKRLDRGPLNRSAPSAFAPSMDAAYEERHALPSARHVSQARIFANVCGIVTSHRISRSYEFLAFDRLSPLVLPRHLTTSVRSPVQCLPPVPASRHPMMFFAYDFQHPRCFSRDRTVMYCKVSTPVYLMQRMTLCRAGRFELCVVVFVKRGGGRSHAEKDLRSISMRLWHILSAQRILEISRRNHFNPPCVIAVLVTTLASTRALVASRNVTVIAVHDRYSNSCNSLRRRGI